MVSGQFVEFRTWKYHSNVLTITMNHNHILDNTIAPVCFKLVEADMILKKLNVKVNSLRSLVTLVVPYGLTFYSVNIFTSFAFYQYFLFLFTDRWRTFSLTGEYLPISFCVGQLNSLLPKRCVPSYTSGIDNIVIILYYRLPTRLVF